MLKPELTDLSPKHIFLYKYTKSACGVDFMLNTAESSEKEAWFNIAGRYKTDFFEFYFFRKALGFVMLDGERIDLHDSILLILMPYQQQEWHVSIGDLDYKPSEVMTDLRAIVGSKPCFILTSNCDEHLEKAGFSTDTVWEIEGTFRDYMNGVQPKDKQPLLGRFLGQWSGKKLAILELGIGSRNRLIKLPLMQLTLKESRAIYITLNLPHEIYIPEEISAKSIALPGDIAETLKALK